MENEFCSDCKRQTQIAVDHRSGDTICTECGLILEAHYIDTTSEWRHFADDDNTKDPNRVGDVAHNPLLSDNGSILTTRINTNNLSKNKKDHHSNGDHPSTNLFRGAKTDQEHIKLSKMSNELESMATRLGNVTKPILYSAQELYKRAHDKKCCKGRNSDAIMAACLYVACGQHGNKRTWKELAAVTNGSAKKKDIVQMKQLLEQKNVLEGGYQTGPNYATPGELVRQCCNALGMDFMNRNAVEETLKNLEEFDIRRQPMSIMAAVVYMIVQLSNDKSTLKDVATASRVAENTIKKTYGDVYPHASKVIPSRFNYDLKKLRAPTSA